MKKYLMSLLVGLSLGFGMQSYADDFEDWEMVSRDPAEKLSDFFKYYNSLNPNERSEFFSRGDAEAQWSHVITEISNFVQENWRNFLRVIDKNLDRALSDFSEVSNQMFQLLEKRATFTGLKLAANRAIMSQDATRIMTTSSNVLDTLLHVKHLSKNKEEARLVLRKAFGILKLAALKES